ncbi:MAG: hypothetical protein R3D57_09045 [Hyphomicrobiaceae bacterium]
MRFVASGVLAVFLAGCSADVTGVGVVAPADVKAYYQETAAEVGDMTAGEYLVASISYTNQRCHEFFDQLAKLKEDSRFLDQVITAGIAAGTPLATVYGVGATTVASWAAGAGLANTLQKDAASIYLFAEFKEELKPLVFREMQSFMVKNKLAGILDVRIGFRSPDDLSADERIGNAALVRQFLDSNSTQALIIARNVATDYAAKCSLANMRTLIADSLQKNNGKQTGEGGALAPTTAVQATEEVAVDTVNEAREESQ